LKVDIRGFPVAAVSRVITYNMIKEIEMFKDSVLVIARGIIYYIYVSTKVR
jgi:hypothetical protein